VIVKSEDIDRVIAEHGGIEVYGDCANVGGEPGPVYELADGWCLLIQPDGTGVLGEPEERP
jgi:hypothetical protein